MVLSQGCVVSNVASYLEIGDLCTLDAASKEISMNIVDEDEETPYAWLAAANHAGLCLVDVDKRSIKATFGALKNCEQILRPDAPLLYSKRGSQELVKAAQQFKNMELKHLQVGGLIAKTFITRFYFSSKDIESYIAAPKAAVTTMPISVSMGKGTIDIALTWHKGTMLLATQAKCDEHMQPFIIHLRAISSPLMMRKEFEVWRANDTQEGSGLCCTSQKASDFAQSMQDGILCIGLMLDSKDGASPPSKNARLASALQLDSPGWSAGINEVMQARDLAF